MDTGILHLHSFLRWMVLLSGFWALIGAFRGMNSRSSYLPKHRRPALWFLIFCDLQLVLGLLLYFTREWHTHWSNAGAMMKNSALRFYSMEHFIMMVLAIALVHVGYSQHKKNVSDQKKFRNQFLYFLIALVIILAMIPWPFREAIGRPWF